MGASDEISPRGSEKEGGTEKAASAEPLDEGTDRTLQGVVQVVSHELLSPRSSEALRKLADECLKVTQLSSAATHKHTAILLSKLLHRDSNVALPMQIFPIIV